MLRHSGYHFRHKLGTLLNYQLLPSFPPVFLTVSMTIKHWLCSTNGVPICCSSVTSVFTCYTNVACTPDFCDAECPVSSAPSCCYVACSSTSKLILPPMYCPITCTIQHLSAHWLPEAITFALLCSWDWPSTIGCVYHTFSRCLIMIGHLFVLQRMSSCLGCVREAIWSSAYEQVRKCTMIEHNTIPPYHHTTIPSYHHSTIPSYHHTKFYIYAIVFGEVDIYSAVHRFIFRYLYHWNT